MEGKYFYINISLRILCIIALTMLTTWFTIKYESYLLIPFGVIFVAILVFQLITYFDKISQKVSFFFDAVENKDSAFVFSEKRGGKSFITLNKSLNRVNKLIQEERIQNKTQEQYYGFLLEQIDFGIVVVDEKSNILQANSAAKKLLNYKTLTHLLQLKKVHNALYDAFVKLKEGKRTLVNYTYDNTTKQLILRATNFSDSKGSFTLISVQDIRNELETKEIESWIKLTRVLTHEIMNSISPITSLSDTLLGYYTDKKNIENPTLKNTIKGLEIIKERGNGLIHFVDLYRKLTKIPQPKIQSIAVKILLQHTLILLENELKFQKIKISIDIIPDDLLINVDKNQITQVLINLLKNAIQAVEKKDNPQIKIKAYNVDNETINISVIDNGIGISTEIMEHIFVPFFTTKENGSGIGLSLSKQIMRNHGGTLKADSAVGQFTRFVLSF